MTVTTCSAPWPQPVALRTGTGFRMTLATPDGRLTLPGIGVYKAHGERVRVVAGPRSLRLTPEHRRTGVTLRPPYVHATGSGWHGLRPLPGSNALLDDLDPRRAGPWTPPPRPPASIPGSAAAGRRRAGVWAARWHAALTLLAVADPDRHSEVTVLVRSLVPLAESPDGTRSATLGSAPWAVLTQVPDNAEGLASVLVHETQHSKLAVLADLTPLQQNGGDAVHRIAWRAGPRPVSAVLQGTYAHLALADLWHRIAAPQRRNPCCSYRGPRSPRGLPRTSRRGPGGAPWF